MQSSGPAAWPGPKFRPGRAFCGTRTTSAGFMLGSGEANSMYYALTAGLRAALERCWPGSMLGSADFMRCRSGLGLGFWRNFCIGSMYLFIQRLVFGHRIPVAFYCRIVKRYFHVIRFRLRCPNLGFQDRSLNRASAGDCQPCAAETLDC